MKKQFSSLLLALLMVFTLLPVQVWATEEEGITSAQESQEDVVDPVSQLPKLTVSEDEETVTQEEETPQKPQPEEEPTQDTPPVEETENDLSADLLDAANADVAGSGECGSNLTWELLSNGTLTISGTGTMTNYDYSWNTPWYNRTVRNVVISSGVTTIGSSAFSNCSSLSTVTLPETLRTIGGSAFSSCNKLKSITIPDSVKAIGNSAFFNCANLSDITLGFGITTISSSLFSRCTNLENIILPEGIKTIEYYAFENCTNLQEVTIPASMISIATTAFQNCPCLTDIYYNAYGEDWGYITGADTAFSDSVTIHYKDNIYGNGWCGVNAEWRLENGVLTISGSGAMYDYDCDWDYNYERLIPQTPWNSATNSITKIVIGNGITAIGTYAFMNCYGLSSVSIPQSVRIIGDWAFSYCESLCSIDLPDTLTSIGNGAFDNCSSLVSINIPYGISKISNDLFFNCTSLIGVSLPAGLTEIGERAFKWCSSLSEIQLPEGIKKIGDHAFLWCESLSVINIPDSVVELGDRAVFALDSINIAPKNRNYCSKDGVLFSKDGSTLLYCPQQKSGSYHIPNGTVAIAANAFHSNTASTVILPQGLKSIGYTAFSFCSALNKITFPSSLESIDSSAFFSCGNLREVIFNDCAATIGDEVFFCCTSLSSVNFGNRLRSISNSAFTSCTSLQTVTIPNSVTIIGDYAFADCSALTSLSLPESITSIAYRTFNNCASLKEVYIPKSIKSIEEYAFSGCNSITDVYYGGQKPQWNRLSINESNLPLLSANIHYAAGLLLNITNCDTIGSDDITVRLTKGSNNYPASIASDGQYSFANNIPAGIYTLSVEKPGYVTYQQEVNYDGSGGLLPSIRLLRPGDINQSGGEADAIDMQRLYEYLTGSYTITDSYLLKVANVNGDDALDVYDLQMLYEMVSRIENTESPSPGHATKYKVAMICDASINDGGWGAACYNAMVTACEKQGWEYEVTDSVSQNQYYNAIKKYCVLGYNLIYLPGNQYTDAALQAAEEYPNIAFVLLNGSEQVPFMAKNGNVSSLQPDPRQIGWIAGALAGLMTKSGKVAFIAAMELDTTKEKILGFKEAAEFVGKQEGKSVTMLNVPYANSFSDTAKGAEFATELIYQGADVFFGDASAVDSGAREAIDAANTAFGSVKIYNIAQPIDILGQNECIICSQVTDNSAMIIVAMQAIEAGNFSGSTIYGTLKNGALSVGKFSTLVPTEVQTKYNTYLNQMTNGTFMQ